MPCSPHSLLTSVAVQLGQEAAREVDRRAAQQGLSGLLPAKHPDLRTADQGVGSAHAGSHSDCAWGLPRQGIRQQGSSRSKSASTHIAAVASPLIGAHRVVGVHRSLACQESCKVKLGLHNSSCTS